MAAGDESGERWKQLDPELLNAGKEDMMAELQRAADDEGVEEPDFDQTQNGGEEKETIGTTFVAVLWLFRRSFVARVVTQVR